MMGHIWSMACSLQFPALSYDIYADVNKFYVQPWLVWLSELSTGLWTKRLPVEFPVKAHAWVVGQVPGWRHVKGN